MTTFLLSFLLLFTILVAFVFGISLGYWAVCGILHFLDPSRKRNRLSRTPTFAHSPSGD
jgi:hypothetical protein